MQRLSETFFEHMSEILRTFDTISCPLHVPQSGGHICRCDLSVYFVPLSLMLLLDGIMMESLLVSLSLSASYILMPLPYFVHAL